jgi:hypothetical protein
MPKDNVTSGLNTKDLQEFRALQDEMLRVSQEYSQARLTAWAEETRSLTESWDAFSREWQGSLEAMSALAADQFEAIAARGEAAGNNLGQSWGKTFTGLSGAVEDWGEHLLQTLGKVAGTWGATLGGGGGAGGGWSSVLGAALDFGGWFHQGGIVSAHQGLVISPGTLMGDEQLVLTQAGEGILPRESMTRLGERNFEALRTGRFGVAPGGAAPSYGITIQVQSMDAAGVASLDWDRVVQRHLLPALNREAARSW